MTTPLDYIRAGWALVPIPKGAKGPRGEGWNTRERCVTREADAGKLTANLGLAHAYSGTCAVDIDQFEHARKWLADRGVDLDALYNAPDAVRISSGRPNRGKLLYRLPAELLRSISLVPYKDDAGKPRHALELRCATAGGKTVQDVLPPSIHPDTGKPYVWEYGDDLIGDWRSPPELPAALLDVWRSIVGSQSDNDKQPACAGDGDIAQVRSLLTNLDPDAPYKSDDFEQNVSWLQVGMALHHEFDGDAVGLDLWDEWSSAGSKYKNRADLETHWRSFGKNTGPSVTIATIEAFVRSLPASADDFEVISTQPQQGKLDDYLSYLPDHRYIHRPTRSLWPAASVDGHTRIVINKVPASKWLDKHRAVQQMTWDPARSEIIENEIVSDGGWTSVSGQRVYNLYRAPAGMEGDPKQAGPWQEHLHRIYPGEAAHIEQWLAHRIQRPGEKVNHALVFTGSQGIGKDTTLEPIKRAVGPWNFTEVSPGALMGRFNGFVKSVVLRISEARDKGGDHEAADRFAFYEHTKTLIAAPPDVLRVDEKHLREYAIVNVVGVIITTNDSTGGIYLPSDDRRHFVATSTCTKEDFADGYWAELWQWYATGGYDHVAAYLRTLDLSAFNPKAPPPKTQGWHAIVAANTNPEDSELSALVEAMGNPDVLTLTDLQNSIDTTLSAELYELFDRKNRRRLPHRMKSVGYSLVANPYAKSGLWNVKGKEMTIYARVKLSLSEQLAAAQARAAK